MPGHRQGCIFRQRLQIGVYIMTMASKGGVFSDNANRQGRIFQQRPQIRCIFWQFPQTKLYTLTQVYIPIVYFHRRGCILRTASSRGVYSFNSRPHAGEYNISPVLNGCIILYCDAVCIYYCSAHKQESHGHNVHESE